MRFRDSLHLHGNRVHGLLQLIEALLELQDVRLLPRQGFCLHTADEPDENPGQRSNHSNDYCCYYGKVCDIGIHDGLGEKLSAFPIQALRYQRARVSISQFNLRSHDRDA